MVLIFALLVQFNQDISLSVNIISRQKVDIQTIYISLTWVNLQVRNLAVTWDLICLSNP